MAAATVLLVEDNTDAVKIFSLYLRQGGYRVVVAADGAGALAGARRVAPAVIVLDLLLPDVDGWEVLARLKACRETRGIPVVIVSVLDRQALGYELGAVDYLVKPVTRERLLRAVRRSLLYREPAGRVPRVLVVHEEPEALAPLAQALAGRGYRVFEALGGEAGCLLDALAPDLVVVSAGGHGFGALAATDRVGRTPVTVAVEIGARVPPRARRRVHAVIAAGERMPERLLRVVARLLSRSPPGGP